MDFLDDFQRQQKKLTEREHQMEQEAMAAMHTYKGSTRDGKEHNKVQEEEVETSISLRTNDASKPQDGNQSPTDVLSFDEDDISNGEQQQQQQRSSNETKPKEVDADTNNVAKNLGPRFENEKVTLPKTIRQEGVPEKNNLSNDDKINGNEDEAVETKHDDYAIVATAEQNDDPHYTHHDSGNKGATLFEFVNEKITEQTMPTKRDDDTPKAETRNADKPQVAEKSAPAFVNKEDNEVQQKEEMETMPPPPSSPPPPPPSTNSTNTSVSTPTDGESSPRLVQEVHLTDATMHDDKTTNDGNDNGGGDTVDTKERAPTTVAVDETSTASTTESFADDDDDTIVAAQQMIGGSRSFVSLRKLVWLCGLIFVIIVGLMVFSSCSEEGYTSAGWRGGTGRESSGMFNLTESDNLETVALTERESGGIVDVIGLDNLWSVATPELKSDGMVDLVESDNVETVASTDTKSGGMADLIELDQLMTVSF